MKKIKVLILEDDTETIAKLVQCLYELQKDNGDIDIAITVLAEYTQVEEYLNKAERNIFDIILLDRDCFAGGSFHALDFGMYSPERIISISSTPPYNEEARKFGVKRIVHKDYQNLDKFVEEVRKHLEEMI